MSRSFFVDVRGVECEVVIERDYGYESDTNAWDVDWHVNTLDGAAVELTDAEEEKIMEHIYNFLREYEP